MVLKRQTKFGGEGSSEFPTKRRHLTPHLFKGVHNARSMQDFVPLLEPIIRKWVREAVESSIEGILIRNSHDRIGCSGSRNLQLQFHCDLPHTLFTGHRVQSQDRTPLKITLCDSSGKAITSGPLSSMRVSIVVLDADFSPDQDEWTKKQFDVSVVQSREGKRPLVTGDLMVTLQNGVGYVRDVSFTDNSSWLRSGKFRLGARANSAGSDDIQEGISSSFKVKDQRGESYQKHHPPCLDDEVWRLEKIAKDGASHKRLTQRGITCVRDFLRLYNTDQASLRAMLPNVSKRTWETIIEHARNCILDNGKYLYKAALGAVLYFNTVYEVIGVTDDQGHSLDHLSLYQSGMVEQLKQHAYRNVNDWVPADPSMLGYPMLLENPVANSLANPDFGVQENYSHEQGLMEMQLNTDRPSISPPCNYEVEQDTSSLELGESSNPLQGFFAMFKNSFEIRDSPGGFYNISQLLTDDMPVTDDFQVDSSVCKATNHEIGITSADTAILIPRNGKPKTRWCKVMAVVKWRIIRRNLAARRTQERYYNNYFY